MGAKRSHKATPGGRSSPAAGRGTAADVEHRMADVREEERQAIHAAMNEPVVSARTCAVLERVGAALGAQEGTGPDDAPLFRSQRRQGFERGFERGRTAGLLEARAELVREMLASRGIAVSVDFPAGVPGFTDLPAHRIAHAAAVCTSEADFRKRLRRGE